VTRLNTRRVDLVLMAIAFGLGITGIAILRTGAATW
jgi:hypothetical protein